MSVTIPFDCDFSEVRPALAATLRPHLGDATDDEVDRLMTDIVNRGEDALEELGRDAADDLRRMLSVPVDFSTSPPTRSLPGEPPRTETGALLESVNYTVYRAGGRDRVSVRVVTNVRYDVYLVGYLNRPFDKLLESRWSRLAENRVAYAMR